MEVFSSAESVRPSRSHSTEGAGSPPNHKSYRMGRPFLIVMSYMPSPFKCGGTENAQDIEQSIWSRWVFRNQRFEWKHVFSKCEHLLTLVWKLVKLQSIYTRICTCNRSCKSWGKRVLKVCEQTYGILSLRSWGLRVGFGLLGPRLLTARMLEVQNWYLQPSTRPSYFLLIIPPMSWNGKHLNLIRTKGETIIPSTTPRNAHLKKDQ